MLSFSKSSCRHPNKNVQLHSCRRLVAIGSVTPTRNISNFAKKRHFVSVNSLSNKALSASFHSSMDSLRQRSLQFGPPVNFSRPNLCFSASKRKATSDESDGAEDSTEMEVVGSDESKSGGGELKLPSAYTILFALVVCMAALTWVIPAGSFVREMSPALGKMVPVPGTYHLVPPSPQGFVSVFLAPVRGVVETVDVMVFLIMIGSFLRVVNTTGAIEAGVNKVVERLKGREVWLIPTLMLIFALGGTTFGLAEETIPFYSLVLPVFLSAGFDAVTAVAAVLVGAGVGVLGGTVNPFATVIAAQAAGVPLASGLWARVVLLVGGWALAVLHIVGYAQRVKADPSQSVVADLAQDHRDCFLGKDKDDWSDAELTSCQQGTLGLFAGFFGVMIWGVAAAGWEMGHMSALFLLGSLCVGLLNRMREEDLTSEMIEGAREMLGVGMVIGLARGMVVVMGDGMITDTVLHGMADLLTQLSSAAFINVMLLVEGLLTFLVPSTSGLAALTMPVMAPLADFAGVSRELLVTAYQAGTGLVNLFTPTSGVVMGALAIGRIPYDRYMKFVAPLLLKLTLLCIGVLSASVFIG